MPTPNLDALDRSLHSTLGPHGPAMSPLLHMHFARLGKASWKRTRPRKLGSKHEI